MASVRRYPQAARGTGEAGEGAAHLGAIIAAAATLAFALTIPPVMVLPALSVALVLAGFAVAALAWRAPQGLAVPAHYLSATLAFLGFGAAVLTDVDQVLRFFDGALRPR